MRIMDTQPNSPAPSTPPPAASPSAPAASPATPGAGRAPQTPGSDAGKSKQQILTEKMMPAFAGAPENVAAELGEPQPETVVEEATPEAALEDAEELAPAEEAPEPDQPEEDGEEALPDFDFEPEEPPTAPQELAAAIDEDPALKDALEANPALRNKVFANARLAAVAAQYNEIFANPDEAKIASQGHQTFSTVREAMVNIVPMDKPGGPESTQAVLNAMFQAAVVHDEDGNPVIDPQSGRPVTDGTVGQMLTNVFKSRMVSEMQKAVQAGDENKQAAFDIVMESLGMAASRPEEGDENEALASERAALQARERELNERDEQARQQHTQAFEERVERSVDGTVDRELNSILDRATGLNQFNRDNLDRAIRTGLRKAIKADPYHKQEFAALQTRPATAKTEKERVALAAKYLHKHLAKVAKPLLEQAGVTALAKIRTKEASATARKVAAQSETRGAGRAARPSAPMTGQQLTTLATEQLTRELGTSRPSTAQILTRVAKLRSGT